MLESEWSTVCTRDTETPVSHPRSRELVDMQTKVPRPPYPTSIRLCLTSTLPPLPSSSHIPRSFIYVRHKQTGQGGWREREQTKKEGGWEEDGTFVSKADTSRSRLDPVSSKDKKFSAPDGRRCIHVATICMMRTNFLLLW